MPLAVAIDETGSLTSVPSGNRHGEFELVTTAGRLWPGNAQRLAELYDVRLCIGPLGGFCARPPGR